MLDFIKIISLSLYFCFAIIITDKGPERPIHYINNRIIYYYTWLWHRGNGASVWGIMCGVGIQTNMILYIICSLFLPELDKKTITLLYLTTLFEIIFSGAMVGTFDLAFLENEKKVKKVSMYLASLMMAAAFVYTASPYLKIYMKCPVLCVASIVMIIVLVVYGFCIVLKRK